MNFINKLITFYTAFVGSLGQAEKEDLLQCGRCYDYYTYKPKVNELFFNTCSDYLESIYIVK